MPKLEQKIYSLDTEATGLDLRHGAKPFFVTICTGEDTWCWEAEVDPLTRQPKWAKSDLLEIDQTISEADLLILQNPRFDVRGLETIGLAKNFPWDKVFDTLMAGHLLVSNQPHDLATMVMINLRINIQHLEDELEVAVKEATKIAKKAYPDWHLAKVGRSDMPSAKSKTWKYDSWLPRKIAIAEGYREDHPWYYVLENYGNGDSGVTRPLGLRQQSLLQKKGLWKIYKERLKLLPVIYDMETCGMTMSESRTRDRYDTFTQEADDCKQRCLEIVDHEIEDLPVNGVSNDLRYAVFDKLGLVSTKKSKKTGKPSMDKFVLDHWIATLPETSKGWKFVKSLRSYRKRKTAIGYIDSYRKFWLPYGSRKGVRIVYPSYNPTGTDTLRFSSQNPNAQQVSKQEEVNTRYCFGPAPGREWWFIDFSNLELRIPAYESNEEEMVFLFEHPDDPPYYGSYHMMIFDTLHPEMFAKHGMECKSIYDDTWYQWTKNGNFAVQYGAVLGSGTADAAYHVPGAQRRIMSRFTQIKKLSRKWIDFANRTGYIEIMPDKTVDPNRGYPLYCTRTSNGRVLETVPLSYHVQGTAMWITSKAMVRCSKYLNDHYKVDGHIICQVHDEMGFDFPVGTGIHHVKKLARLMEKSGDDVGVPLGTTIYYHPNNWNDKEKWDVKTAA